MDPHIKRRIGILNGVVLCALIAVSVACSAAWPKRGPYLIYPGTPTEMTILWQLDSSQHPCSLAWGLDTTYAVGTLDFPEEPPEHLYTASLTELLPTTLYHYQLRFGDSTAESTFRTAPPEGSPRLRFLGWADTQIVDGGDPKSCYTTVARATLSALQDDLDMQTFMLHAGDWVYSPKDSYWQQFFSNRYARQVMSKLPVQGCIGNHDVPLGDKSDTFLECWPYPYEADHYWSFDYGPVHVAVIDQFTDEMWSAPPDSSARQIEWLRRDLRENERPWTIVLLHIPIREDHTYGGGWDARLVATRLLSALQHEEVDLLVCGHEHVHAFGETGGIPQLTMGSASDRDGTPSFYIYNVSATTLTVTAYSPQGTAIDVVSVER